jgi:hypothetical protein
MVRQKNEVAGRGDLEELPLSGYSSRGARADPVQLVVWPTAVPKWLPHFCERAWRANATTSTPTDLHFISTNDGRRRCAEIGFRNAPTSLWGCFQMFCQEIPCKRTCLTRLNEKEGGWIFDTMLCELMIFIAARALHQLSSLSIASLHFGPKRLMAQIVRLLSNAQTPKIVNNQPLPTAFMIGAATMAPTQEKMFLTKLLTATPFDDCLGMNSVSIVVAMAKISIDPIP